MFGLRNAQTTPAVEALAEGLLGDKSSALFRHEVAYVLGQMQHGAAVHALGATVENERESAMVRHEAAVALGAIGTPECIELLERFKHDSAPVVSDSCIAALDTIDYWAQQAAPVEAA